MTWFIEGENSEVWAEAASSAVGVVSTLNDHLVADESDDDDEGDARSSPNRGEIDSAYGNESDGRGGARRRHRRSAQGIRAGRQTPAGFVARKARGTRRVRPGALGAHPVFAGGDAVGDDREPGGRCGGRGGRRLSGDGGRQGGVEDPRVARAAGRREAARGGRHGVGTARRRVGVGVRDGLGRRRRRGFLVGDDAEGETRKAEFRTTTKTTKTTTTRTKTTTTTTRTRTTTTTRRARARYRRRRARPSPRHPTTAPGLRSTATRCECCAPGGWSLRGTRRG